MKRLLAALAALFIAAAPAHAAVGDYVQQFRKPYAQRVAVVFPSRWDALNQTNVKNTRQNLDRAFGNTIEMLAEQGAEIHYYNTGYFRRTTGGQAATDCRNLWYQLGTYYPLVLIGGMGCDQSLDKFFFCADSTTAKLIHYGGAEAIGWNDSTYTGIMAATRTAGSVDITQTSASTYARMALRPYGTTDTLRLQKFGVMKRCATLPVPFTLDSMTKVVRIFEPLSNAIGNVNNSPISSADSFAVNALNSQWQVADSTATNTDGFFRWPDAGDSVAIARDLLPLAWRVYWNTTNGRSVDFVKSVPSPIYANNIGHVLYALCSRYVQLDPVRIAVDFDDVFDADTTGVPRATNAAWDSTFTALAAYGLKPGIAVNPQNASQYIQGADSTYEGTKWDGTVGAGINPWGSAAAWSWPNNRAISWVHHAHDSTGGNFRGNLVGRFGGYTRGNGSSVATTATWGTRYLYSNRYANRFNPGNTSDSRQQYGIVQRLQYSDSLRRARCPQCVTPPYLNFPNNEVLPINWRARTGVSGSSWGTTANLGSTTTNQGTAVSANGALDSLYYAFAKGLNVPDRGTLYLRTPFVTSTGPPQASTTNYQTRTWGDNSVKNYHLSNDRDSMVANTPFAFPGERSVARLESGKLVDVQALSTISYDGGDVDGYRSAASNALSALYGTRNAVQTGGHPAPIVGETFSSDSTWANPYRTNTISFRNFTSHQRSRIVYCHPSTPTSQFVNATGPRDSYNIDVLMLGVLQGKKALDDIAGHKTALWVMPWEVMAKP